MEKGHLRADVNVSVRKPGAPFGTRCEIKNLNSIRFIGQAIEHEAWRQIGIIEDGGAIEQETRLFDPDKGETRSMRSKEEAHDYRYFPDPDLLPLELAPSLVDGLGSAACRNCRTTRRRASCATYGLSGYDAGVLVAERGDAEFFEAVVRRALTRQRRPMAINEYLGRTAKTQPPIGSSTTGLPGNGSISTKCKDEQLTGRTPVKFAERRTSSVAHSSDLQIVRYGTISARSPRTVSRSSGMRERRSARDRRKHAD